MKLIITGSAGFIGYSLSKRLLENNLEIIGIDNHNNYYDTKLKEARFNKLIKHSNYQGIATFDEGKASMEGFDERVDLPATERIQELIEEGLSPEEIIMRGFSFEKVTEALKNGA